MITAVIPVRKGSTRCKNKNIRDFSDNNLLQKKIELLKKVRNLDKILVSSNCENMLSIARNLDVETHVREEKYCTTNCSGTDLYLSLANAVETEHILLTFCVTPFVKIETYENIIDIYKDNLKTNIYDSVSTSFNFKHYIWHNNKPINYKYDEAPPTQSLPDYLIPTFGINITSKKFVLENKNVIGKNPYFYDVDQIESIDIDTPYEFLLSEMLYNNNILTCDTATNILRFRDNSDLQLIDCTISDSIDCKQIKECYEAVSLSKINYFEVNNQDQFNLLKNCDGCKLILNIYNYENIIEIIKDQKLACIKFKIDNIDQIKIIKEYSMNYLKSRNNLEIFLSINKINNEELEVLYDTFNEINIKGIIIEDNGLFNENNLLSFLFNLYSKFSHKKICIGFKSHHLHLNKLAIFNGCTMITSSIGGIGNFIGNLKSEEILCQLHLCNKYDITNLLYILKYYDKYIESKDTFILNKKYHPYFNFSNIKGLSFNNIDNIINSKLSIEDDFLLLT